MGRPLSVDDASLLKFALAIVLEARLGYTREQVKALGRKIATPAERAASWLKRLGRLQVDGRTMFRIHSESKDGDIQHDFEYLIDEAEVLGGSRTVAQALLVKLHALLGTPVPADERESAGNDELTEAAVTRLAASFTLREDGPVIH